MTRASAASVPETKSKRQQGSARRRERLFIAISMAGAFAVVALLAEVAARFWYPAPLPWRTPQHAYEASPTLGFRYRPSQTAFTADKPFRTNALGLRGAEVARDKPAGTKRVIVLGDSIAMGYGVREENSFASVVGRGLSASFEIINAGVAAYNTEQEVNWFLESGRHLAPDVVVIEVYWNDISSKDQVAVTADGVLFDRDGTGDRRGAFDGQFGYALRNLFKRSRALYIAGMKIRQLKSGGTDRSRGNQMAVLQGQANPEVERGWAAMESQLARLRAACAEIGAALVVVVPPMPQQLAQPFPAVRYQSVMRAICERLSLKCLDLLPAFTAAWSGHESLFIPYDGDHPNEAGHALIGRELLAYLTEVSPGGLGLGRNSRLANR